ncbi:acid phosphatase/Vanadium-dependent haloperoxidase [Aspergillus steynii IBT 23096]|uniref:Acid phosphatase/Vanadium-dependent haloperoxidase n=1 Tax=Aspergillus steynii IBT 23096 TaxID=1392250 RepID=A0A2I2FTM5_9EURO|nr:acid phosphatase/Vanadium-dependent haloperoxidase [Aspergillus steynii IBT 23096]PLB43964.1 acid phosphatase/Vanadium-dependent haloperoxidase [Aspergillus steynii IBT 23096]
MGSPMLANARVGISKRLVLSYIIDWIFIIGIALIGYGFSRVTPNHRPFALTDQSISFPYTEDETVRTSVLVVVSLIAPAVIIFLIWEWNAGWLGLGLSVAGVFMATQGLKALYGRPRPDMLARCDPDLSDIASYAVGGLGQRLTEAPTLVSWEICRNKSDDLKVNGFSSFPSGHSSIAFAGLAYFSLWLCSKFSIGFPYLAHSPLSQELRVQNRESIRTQGAAPPVYTVIIAFVPLAVAFFIAASRWFDFRHHAFDIIIGSLMGLVFAWVGFRLYHLPIMRGAGWSWGARSPRHAFFKGVGLSSHVGADNWSNKGESPVATGAERQEDTVDLESGRRDLAE